MARRYVKGHNSGFTREAIARGQRLGRATQRKQFYRRVAATVKPAIEPLADRIPLPELVTAAAAIWRRAYALGYQSGHATGRRRVGAR